MSCNDKPMGARECVKEGVAVKPYLYVRGSYGREPQLQSVAQAADAGLRYRVPAAGTLRICRKDVGKDDCGKQVNPVLRLDGDISQFGAVFTLPFSSPLFASGSFRWPSTSRGA